MVNPKVTINSPKPSEQVVEKSQKEVIVKDSSGRSITLKKPGVLAQFRLIELLGDSAKNEVYTSMVLPIIFVSAIDGDVVMQPNSKRELEFLIQRLDEHGIQAVSHGLNEHFENNDTEKDKAAIKK